MRPEQSVERQTAAMKASAQTAKAPGREGLHRYFTAQTPSAASQTSVSAAKRRNFAPVMSE